MTVQLQTAEDSRVGKHNRRGRPRVSGERTATGQLSRAADAIEGRESVAQLVQRRSHKMLLLNEFGDGVCAEDPISVLSALKHIDDDEAAAGAEFARLHDRLYGPGHPKPIMNGGGRSTEDPEDPDVFKRHKATEERYGRALGIIGACGGNSVTIARFVCCAHQMPVWVQYRAIMTVDRKSGAVTTSTGGHMDRGSLRAMQVQLPALRKALKALSEAGYAAVVRRGRRT